MADETRTYVGTSWLITGLSFFTVGMLLDGFSHNSLWEYVQISLLIVASGCMGASLDLHLLVRRQK